MTNTSRIWMAVCAVLAAALGLDMALYAQSTTAGVYTAAQAKRGTALYTEQCASCHGDDLKGSDIIPGLTGETFMADWQGKSLGDLFEKIEVTMPALDPGSLKPPQTADLIAYILSVAKYPAGNTDLASSQDALQQIKIDAVK